MLMHQLGRMGDELDDTCPVCLELLLRPVELSCGHRFCRGCWTSVLQSHNVRSTAHLTGSVACPFRCEVTPVVPEVDEALASQLASDFAAEYRERSSSTSLPEEERRVAEVSEWAAQGCKPNDTQGAEEVARTQERTGNWLLRATVITAFAGAGLLFMFTISCVIITLHSGLAAAVTKKLWLVLCGFSVAVVLLGVLLFCRMQQLSTLAVTPARNATPPAEGDALPESRHFVCGRLWSRMNLLLCSTPRALTSSSTSTRATTHAVVRRSPQANAPQPQSLSEIAIVL